MAEQETEEEYGSDNNFKGSDKFNAFTYLSKLEDRAVLMGHLLRDGISQAKAKGTFVEVSRDDMRQCFDVNFLFLNNLRSLVRCIHRTF